MYRAALAYLKEWKTRKSRKPLVIRGARQVGKSFLVRQFAQEEFKYFLEINLETAGAKVEVVDLTTGGNPPAVSTLPGSSFKLGGFGVAAVTLAK